MNFILRIDHGSEPLCLHQFDAQARSCETINISGWSDQALSGLELIILVPASWVYHSQTHVASKNTELLAKSIPFAIEEELSNDVEDNYCAFKLNTSGSQDVIAIEKLYLDGLNNQLEAHDVIVSAIHSEVDWLPVQAKSLSLWQDKVSVLLRLDQYQAMRVETKQLEQLLPVFTADKEQIICNQDFDLTGTGLSGNQLAVNDSLTAATCCGYLLANEPIDLYLDEIKTTKSQSNNQNWRWPKVLVGFLVLSWILVQGIQWYYLEQSIVELKQQQKNLFQQQYPNAAPVELVDPFAALQSRLKLQNSTSTSAKSMLVEVVNKLGQVINEKKSVSLNGLRLVGEKMELQISAPNMTTINDFQQQLQLSAVNYSVQIGVNELSDDNTFKSILTLVPR